MTNQNAQRKSVKTTLALMLTAGVACVGTGPAPASAESLSPNPQTGIARLQQAPDAPAIRRMLEATGATRIHIHDWTTQEAPSRALSRLPLDTFAVSTAWADFWRNGRKDIAFYGRWSYKGGFIGSGSPDDISAMRVTGFPMTCWTKVSAGVRTTNEYGQRTYLSYARSDGHASSIWAVQDRTRAFQLENRYGFHWIDMRRDRVLSACRARKAGSYFVEHNQSGNGGWSASVSMWGLAVSYSGSSGETLQKAAKFDYL